jgi:hypothetical protein
VSQQFVELMTYTTDGTGDSDDGQTERIDDWVGVVPAAESGQPGWEPMEYLKMEWAEI